MQTRLPFFGVIRVSGDDRADFLHNQLSNDVNHLAVGQACYATYNTPKGRVSANMLVLNRGEDLLLLTAADLLEPLIKRLRMFVLRAKVVFEVLEHDAVAAVWTDGLAPLPAAEPTLSFAAEEADGVWTIHLPHQGRLQTGAAEKLAAYDAEAENAWQLHEIRSGYPWISAATKDLAVAQMLNQHVIGGVHFRKGCYPGQEIIARAQYRGQVKRGLALLSSPVAQSAGAAVLHGGEEAGQIINTAHTESGSLSLAVIKFAAAAQALADEACNTFTVERVFFEQAEEA